MTTTQNIDMQAELLLAKVRHYLITMMGRSADNAHVDELYRALSFALREEIMINWAATAASFVSKDVRMLYYLSMEYLPGRLMSNNIINIASTEIVKAVLQKLGRGYDEIVNFESDPGLGNGGLGRLASCLLDSLATLKYPAQGYGLRYQYGIFEQQVWNGMQIEAPDCWLLNEYPWEFRRDWRKVAVKYGGEIIPSRNIHGDEITSIKNYDEVWALPYDIPVIGFAKDHNFSVITLRLWSTKESPRNFQLQRYNAGRLDQAAENTTLTDVLYPSDNHEIGKRVRLKQEYLLVSSSVQDIIRHYVHTHSNFRDFADKVRIQINDTHPTLVIAELVRILTKEHDIPWNLAVDMTRQVTGYTNHTILSEALETWDTQLMQQLLPRQYQVIERLNLEFCNQLRVRYPDDEAKVRRMSIIENGKVRMANLAIFGSHKVNGVAALHTEILKSRIFKDFYDLDPDKFVNITNGVTQRRWILLANPELATFLTNRIGDGWITNFEEIKKIAPFANDPESRKEFLSIKRRNKNRLIDYLSKTNKFRDEHGVLIGATPLIDPNSLFDVQIKRIHEYKRQLMNALHLIILYFEILENPEHHGRVKRTAIIAGKAAAGYETAKNIIRLINCLARKINHDPIVSKFLKVIYVENYNVSRAEMIIPAADLSEQISTAGTEASGTGNMKLTMNGALTIGTNDGANIEMKEAITDAWWPFAFGVSADEVAKEHASGYDPHSIYNNNLKIQRAVEALQDGTFTQTEDEHHALLDLYQKLLVSHYGGAPDFYLVLKDLPAYCYTQKKVEEFYQDSEKWAEYALHNIAGMGSFSADTSIKNYAQLIWGIKPCPADEEVLEGFRDEFNKADKCRIF